MVPPATRDFFEINSKLNVPQAMNTLGTCYENMFFRRPVQRELPLACALSAPRTEYVARIVCRTGNV